MSGFSPDWLALREPVDHRSRDRALGEELRLHFARRTSITVVDLGCGAGSNIRATYALLPQDQSWTLVDYDARLLTVSRERLAEWADRSSADGDAMVLAKDGKRLRVEFRQADLNVDLDRALGEKPDLVTASALFDLCSEPFVARFAKAVAARRSTFYTVLTYNGEQSWAPTDAVDGEFAAAFHAHQKTDKGFGVSAGPDAPRVLAETFRQTGAVVTEGNSPWLLDAADHTLIDDLSTGFAAAVRETGVVASARIDRWLKVRRAGAIVGHTDTLAVPG